MLMKWRTLNEMILRSPDGEGGGGGEAPAPSTILGGDGPASEQGNAPADGQSKEPEHILFPGDKKPDADGKPAAEDGAKPEDPPADWKEYVDDPAKSAEENAALKAENDAKKPADPDDPMNKVPEDGKYDVKVPEGIPVDDELLGALSPKFKEANLTQGQVQKLMDEYIRVNEKRTKEYLATPAGMQQMATQEYFKTAGTPDKWLDQAKSDPKYGGENWNKTVEAAMRGKRAVQVPGLNEYFEATGAGNHLPFIALLAEVGHRISEDKPVGGGSGGSGRPAETAHVLFPNDKPKG